METKEKAKDPTQLQLLSEKPILYAFNTSEKGKVEIPQMPNSITIDIKKEFEVSELDEKDREELGEKSALPDLIKKAYEFLGLITYFTAGEDESRAWTIPKDSTAPRAGRAIHGDFEQKFIRADIISYEKFIEAGSWARARELGTLRTEGREYIVQDGDVIEFKI